MKEQTPSAIRILHRRYYKGRTARLAALERERERCNVDQKIYDLRKQLNLYQEELAAKVGMKPSAISRPESGD